MHGWPPFRSARAELRALGVWLGKARGVYFVEFQHIRSWSAPMEFNTLADALAVGRMIAKMEPRPFWPVEGV